MTVCNLIRAQIVVWKKAKEFHHLIPGGYWLYKIIPFVESQPCAWLAALLSVGLPSFPSSLCQPPALSSLFPCWRGWHCYSNSLSWRQKATEIALGFSLWFMKEQALLFSRLQIVIAAAFPNLEETAGLDLPWLFGTAGKSSAELFLLVHKARDATLVLPQKNTVVVKCGKLGYICIGCLDCPWGTCCWPLRAGKWHIAPTQSDFTGSSKQAITSSNGKNATLVALSPISDRNSCFLITTSLMG